VLLNATTLASGYDVISRSMPIKATVAGQSYFRNYNENENYYYDLRGRKRTFL